MIFVHNPLNEYECRKQTKRSNVSSWWGLVQVLTLNTYVTIALKRRWWWTRPFSFTYWTGDELFFFGSLPMGTVVWLKSKIEIIQVFCLLMRLTNICSWTNECVRDNRLKYLLSLFRDNLQLSRDWWSVMSTKEKEQEEKETKWRPFEDDLFTSSNERQSSSRLEDEDICCF